MNWKKIYLGSLFIILSGVLYEIDKMLSYYFWATNIKIKYGVDGYSSRPDTISISDNPFILIFLIIGVLFYINAFISINKKK